MIENLIISSIRSANSIEHRSYIRHSRKNRSCSALLFKVEGETLYTFNGTEHNANCNNCIFLPKGIDYSFEIKELGLCYSVEFDIINQNKFALPQVFHMSHPENVFECVRKLIKYWNDSNCSNAKRMYEIYRIINEISMQEKIDYSIENKTKIIENSVEYLNKNYLKPDITNAEIASVSRISEVYFRKIFTNIYGVSPKRYIIGLKIKKAEELLSSDYSTVEDIAFSSGFTNVYHFIKTFRSVNGCTPTEYAANQRKNSITQ